MVIDALHGGWHATVIMPVMGTFHGMDRTGFIRPGMFIPHLVGAVPCSEMLISRPRLFGKPKVFSDFHERPLELQPGGMTCTYVCVYNVLRNVTITISQTQRETKGKQRAGA